MDSSIITVKAKIIPQTLNVCLFQISPPLFITYITARTICLSKYIGSNIIGLLCLILRMGINCSEVVSLLRLGGHSVRASGKVKVTLEVLTRLYSIVSFSEPKCIRKRHAMAMMATQIVKIKNIILLLVKGPSGLDLFTFYT